MQKAIPGKENTNMKLYLRIFTLILALVLALSVFVGCDEPDGPDTDDPIDDGGDNLIDFPDVERTDYNEDVNVLIIAASNPDENFIIDEEQNKGDPMSEAVYARQQRVNRFIGVELVKNVPKTQNIHMTYSTYIESAVKNMDSTVEIALTHVYGCVAGIITENYLQDIGELDGVDLEADYWNMGFMETLELNGNYYLGFSDYNLLRGYVLTFNKDMLAKYEGSMKKSVYDLVSDYEWTLDEMISLANLVYLDETGNGKSPDDTYGLSGTCGTAFCGFLTSSNIPMMAQDESGSYKVAVNNALNKSKTQELVSKLKELESSNYAYFDNSSTGAGQESVPITSGRTLMAVADTFRLPTYLSYNVDFGVLPLPMYDSTQKDVGYKTLQWGGYIGVLSYQKNMKKIEDTLELLAYYSENVKITYYEKLLGKQVADMPEDAAMLDIIWDSVATDVGQTFAGVGSTGNGILYMVPELMNSSGSTWANKGFGSYMASKENAVNEGFKSFMNGLN